MNDGNSGKLLFLRDRAKRPSPRVSRRRAESTKRPSGEGRQPASEMTWLSRALYAVAAYHVIYWLAIAVGVLSLDGDGELRSWTISLVVADLVVAVIAVLGAMELARGDAGSTVFSRVAAGALIGVASVRLGHAAAASFVRDLFPSERLEIVAIAACFVVGSWILSHALRLRTDR